MTIDELRRVCVVGAGLMGRQIALNAAHHGFTVRIWDANAGQLQAAERWTDEYIAGRIEKGRWTRDEAAAARAKLSFAADLAEALRLNPALEGVRVELARDYVNSNDGHAARDLLDATPESQKGSMALLVQRNWALWVLDEMAEMRQGIDRGLAQARSGDFLIQDGLWRLKSGDAAGARRQPAHHARAADPCAGRSRLLALVDLDRVRRRGVPLSSPLRRP